MSETRRMRPLLGTFVEIGVDGGGASAQNAIDAAFTSIGEVEALMSFQDPDSDISRLNRRPGQWQTLSRSSLQVLHLARAMGIASRNRFNCTVGGQLVSWGALPDHGPAARIDIGEAQDIEIRCGAARLRRAVRITLDGIAKGFAVDRAIGVLQRRGVACGWVNAGGDLRVYGGRGLDVCRRELDGRLSALGCLRNGAVSTSYTGAAAQPDLPARLVCASGYQDACGDLVSVLAPRAWRADALTKVAGGSAASERASLVAALGGTLLGPDFHPA